MGEFCFQIIEALYFSLWSNFLIIVHIIFIFLHCSSLELRLNYSIQELLTKQELVNFASTVFFIIIGFTLDIEFHYRMNLFLRFATRPWINCILAHININSLFLFEVFSILEVFLFYDNFKRKAPFVELNRLTSQAS